nr:DMT family transporter [Motilibacter deserti]
MFLAMSVIWGIPYLLIRVAVRDFPPDVLVFARTAPPAVLLTAYAAYRGMLRPLLPHWRMVLLYSLVELAGPWLLLSHAEVRLSSSLAALLIATTPLVAAVLARLGGSERIDSRRLLGLTVGVAGVVTLAGVDVHADDMVAVGEALLTAVGYAVGPFIVARRLAHLPSLGVISSSLAVVAVLYAPFAVWHWPSSVSGDAAVSVVVLSVVCTAVAFIVFFALIAEAGPARASVITYVNPAVAVVLGVLLLDEPFTLGIAIGFPLVLLGSVLATAKPRREPAAGATGGSEALAAAPTGRAPEPS